MLAATAALIARAGQIQLVQASYWSVEADDLLAKHKLMRPRAAASSIAKPVRGGGSAVSWMPALTMPRLPRIGIATPNGFNAKAVAAAERRSGQFFLKASVADQKKMIAEESDRIRTPGSCDVANIGHGRHSSDGST